MAEVTANNVWLLAVALIFLPLTDGGSVTWYEPPPVETTSDDNIKLTAYSRQLREGSTDVLLSWNFSLTPDLDLIAVFLTLDGVRVATVVPSSGNAGLATGFEERFNVTWTPQRATLIIFNVSEDDDGEFGCTLNTFQGAQNKLWERKMNVEVIVPVSLTNVSPDQTVREGSNLQLLCEATGKPPPNITWTRVLEDDSNSEVLHHGPTWGFPNINRNASGTYHCTAYNRIGNPVRREVKVNVAYPVKIVRLVSEHEISTHQRVFLDCQAESNPPPSYSWTPCDPQQSACNESVLHFQVSNTSVYTITCRVENTLGSDTRNTTLFIASDVINVTLVITSEECTDGEYNQLWEKLNKTVNVIFAGKLGYESVQLRNIRCGSVIADLALKFSSTVRESEVLSTFQDAVNNGQFGDLTVSDITGTRDTGITTTMATTPTSSSDIKACGDCACNCTVLGVVIGIHVLIIIALVVYILWLHKKGTATRDWVNRAVYNEERGETNSQVEMDDIRLDRDPAGRQYSSKSSLQSQYTSLEQASRLQNASEDRGNNASTNTAQSSQYAPLHPSTRSWEVPRQHVTVEKIIGKGAFSQVAKGTAINLRGRPGKTLLAIKKLKENAPGTDKRDLLSELEIMKQLQPHPHVIKLLGCVTESEPLLVLIEYVPFGDLLGYLRKSRGLNDTYYKDPDIKPKTSLTSQQLIKFAWQIADGMSYLSSKRIIHRDLAARNVLVGERETCKVTDFGMARDVQEDNIYERKTKGRLPVKWTAMEALLYGTYSTKSDVWSFGVLLYEIFTIGGSPYPRMDGRKIVNWLQQGHRMTKPQHVDKKLYGIMTKCWQKDADGRPIFTELRNELKEMENQHKSLINMKMYDKQLYANVEDLVV